MIPASHFYIKSMVFAADRTPYAHNLTGFVPRFRGDPLSVSEIGFSPGRKASAVRAQDNVGARKGYAGLYRFGGAYNPGKFVSTSSNKPVSGNYLIYGMASQALYRKRPDTDRGIDLTAGADWTPPDRTRNNQDLTVGVRWNEPLPAVSTTHLGLPMFVAGSTRLFQFHLSSCRHTLPNKPLKRTFSWSYRAAWCCSRFFSTTLLAEEVLTMPWS